MTEGKHIEPKTDEHRPIDIAGYGVLLLAVLYVTGFIVVFTHNERLGLLTAPSDFFQLRYLHVGVLACAFIGICTSMPFLLAVSLADQKSPDLRDILARLAQLATVGLITVGIYTLLAFAPPRHLSNEGLATLVLFGLVGTVHIFRMQWLKLAGNDHSAWGWVLRLILVCLAGLFFFFQIAAVPWSGRGWWMRLVALVALCLLMGAALGRLMSSRPSDKAQQQNWVRRVAPFCLLLAFWYYVIAYGYGIVVYPRVPLTKGGGDFAYATAVALRVRSEDEQALTVSAREALSQPVVILLETGECLYVVPDPGESERAKWGSESPVEFYVIPRECIAAIEPARQTESKR